jgi:hypothetical protein
MSKEKRKNFLKLSRAVGGGDGGKSEEEEGTLNFAHDVSVLPDTVDEENEKRNRTLNDQRTPHNNNARHRYNNSATIARISQHQNSPKPTDDQLSVLYNNCIKLMNENKINTKNAFQLKLIDYMSDIVLNKNIVGVDSTNFQAVGATIDVGAKIYGARVDALHQNTYQMLSGLTNMNNNGEDEFDSEMAVSSNEQNVSCVENLEVVKQANPKKKRSRKHIVENLDTITLKHSVEFTDVRLFYKENYLSRFGKLSGPKNLCLNIILA